MHFMHRSRIEKPLTPFGFEFCLFRLLRGRRWGGAKGRSVRYRPTQGQLECVDDGRIQD